MAVEIPVFIDIEQAFNDAARRVDTASKPLVKRIEEVNGEMRINVSASGDLEASWEKLADILKNVRDYVGDTNFAMAKLQNGLQNTKAKYDELNASIAHRGTPASYAEKERMSNMRNAIIVMEQEVELRTRSSRIATEEAQRQIAVTRAIDDGNAALAQEARTMKEISDKIAALKGKLQNLTPLSSEWTETANEIRRATEELASYDERLRQILTPSSQSSAGSINRIREEMQRLQREWDAMSHMDKFDPNGQLSARAQTLVNNYRRLADESERYGRSLSDAAGKATASVNRTTNALNRQSRSLRSLSGIAASYFSAYGVLRFAKQVRDVTGELEFQRVALQRLIQDEEYGAQLFERIKAAAQESPFRIQQLVTYTKQLAAYRVEQEKLFDTTKMLADISAGLGVEMNRLILAYGQVKSASVLRGQELRQFTEAGIPLVQLLADKFSDLNGKMVKTSEVFELISKRAVPFSMISEIFEDMTEKGGMFYEMQAKQAETLKGRWEKLKDAFDVGLQSVGETKTFEVGIKAIINIMSFLAKNLRVIVKLVEAGTAAWVTYTLVSRAAAAAVASVSSSEARAAAVTEAHTIAASRGIRRIDAFTNAFVRQKLATNALDRAFWKLWAAVIANPLGALLGVISAITAAVFLFKKKTDEATKSFEEFDNLIERTSKGLTNTEKLDKVIDRYETLAQKTDRTIKENNRLYQTMSKLQEAFPEVAIGIDNESDSLEKQIVKLRELNDEKERELRNAGETSLRVKEIELAEEEKKRNKLYKERLQLQKQLASVQAGTVQKGSSAEKEWSKRLNEVNEGIVKQDEYIGKLQKRIERLYSILYPDSGKNPLNAWQRQIQEMSEIDVNGITSQIFTVDDIEKWETLDQALTTINSKIAQTKKREDELSNSVKNQTGEIKEQIETELEWIRVERLRLEAMERFFKTPTLFAQSLSKNFSDALLDTFDEGNIRKWGEAALGYISMQTNLRFNPELLLARPLVDAAKLVEKGWEDAGAGIATVFSSVYDWEDEKGNKHNVMVTPILPDGSILSPEELDAYVRDVLIKTNFKDDDKQLLLGIDVSEDAGERLHEMQERYYQMIQMAENLPEDFLVTKEELQKLKQASDVVDLVENKIKNIEEEIKKTEAINIEAISDEEAEKTEKYLENLNYVYEILKRIRGTYKQKQTDDYSALAQEIYDNFKDALKQELSGDSGVTVPVNFLISDKELQSINNTVDLFGVLDKKIQGIREEIEEISLQNLEGVITDEAREQAELYSLSLQNILNTLLIIRGRYQNTFSPLANEIQGAFPRLMESFYAGQNATSYVKTGLFSEEDLKRLRTYVDLQDLVTSKYSSVKSALEKYNGRLNETINLETRRNILAQIEQLEGDKKAIEDLAKAYGIILEKTTPKTSTEDPWILIFKNRLKFVKDFSRGVQDMNKYMAETNAIEKERQIMEGRGLNLGFTGKGELDVRKMTGSREEVLKWYDDTIEKIQKKIQSLGGSAWAGLGVQAILAKDTKSRTLKAWQDLLADVFKEKTDFDLSQTEKDLKDAISKIKDEIKRSEEAKNFFKDILDTTGDQDLATSMTISVYGDVGSDFKDRIQKELNAAFKSFESPDFNLWKKMGEAVKSQDWNYILKNLDQFPIEWQKRLKEMADADQKYNAEQAKNLLKTLQKAKTYSEKRIELARKNAERIAAINAMDIPEEQKAVLRKQLGDTDADDVAKLQYDVFKNSAMYIKLFDNLDVSSTRMLTNMRDNLIKLKENWKDLDPTQLKEMQNRLNEIDKQLAQQNPFAAIADGLRKYSEMGGVEGQKQAEEQAVADKAQLLAEQQKLDVLLRQYEVMRNTEGVSEQELADKLKEVSAQQQLTDKAKKQADASQQAADAYGEEQKKIKRGINALGDYINTWQTLANSLKAIRDYIADVFDLEDIPVVDEMLEGISTTLSFVAAILPVIIALSGTLNTVLLANPFIAMAAAIIATIGAIVGLIKGIVNAKVERLNKKIEEQDELIDDLEYQYSRLGKAIEDAFGSDYIYNYNKQLEALQAQAAAYREQARLEREKGKKADEDTAKGYEESARDIEDQITDMQGQLAEFFAGTDLTSAAKDFAQAWIDAYKEFGNTTDAMKEKFNDMIESMVVNSLAAQLIQSILKPVFDAVDEAAKDGELTAQEIGSVSAMLPERMAMIDNAMTNMVNQLTSAGVNLRQQAGQFTGISRNIAGASEESITGLAAGINTQNFYMQHIDASVTAILAYLTGGSTVTNEGAPGATTNPYQDAMLGYAEYIPQIFAELVALRTDFRGVITHGNVKAQNKIAVDM